MHSAARASGSGSPLSARRRVLHVPRHDPHGSVVCRFVRAVVPVLAVLLALAGCGDDGDGGGAEEPAATTTTTTGPAGSERVCEDAAATIGAADPPADLAGVEAGAEAIAARTASDELGAGVDPELVAALSAVGDGALLLATAASSGDPGEMTDAVATLTAAYDELDLVAAELQIAACTSESWGRQVAIAAVDLTGVGG